MDWDEYYMGEAYHAAVKSKDQSTQVGCVIVGPDNERRTSGYNNFPRGWNDDDPRSHERPFKYQITEHSERNAIYNAARVGIPLKGCRIYVPWFPCCDCARSIIQSGIVEVILHKEFPNHGGWSESQEVAKELFDTCGVDFRYWSGKIAPLKIRHSGKLIDPTNM